MKMKTFFAVMAFLVTRVCAAPCDVSLKADEDNTVTWNNQGVPQFSEVLYRSPRNSIKADIQFLWSPSFREQNSFLGLFWMFPLMDAFCTKSSDGEYFVCKPDGRTLKLAVVKSEKSGTGTMEYLDGAGGWKGIARGRDVSLVSSCGTRMRFVNGKITNLSLKGLDYKWIYEKESASVEENGSPLLKVSLTSGGIFVDVKEKRFLLKKEKILVGGKEFLSLASVSDLFSLKFKPDSGVVFIEKEGGWTIGFDPLSNRITLFDNLRFSYKQPDSGTVPEISVSDIKYNTLRVSRSDPDEGVSYSQFWSGIDGTPHLENESRTEFHTDGVLKGAIKTFSVKDENGLCSWVFVYNEQAQCILKKNQAGLEVDTTGPVEVVRNAAAVAGILNAELALIKNDIFDSISRQDIGRMSKSTMRLWAWCLNNYRCDDGISIFNAAKTAAMKNASTTWIVQSLDNLANGLKERKNKYKVL